VYDPMINLILQGSKSMTVGAQTLHYDPATYFVMSVDLPAAGVVRPAATGEPYLAVSLTLDPPLIAGLLADLPHTAGEARQASGFSVAKLMGWMLRDVATPDTALARVNRIIQHIRRSYAQPLRVAELAEGAAMSVSAFHRHFKAVTTLSPLQYQKQVRLLQARTLLVAAGFNVTAAAHEVGYESPTQFSREYARAFGLSPAKDAARIIAGMRPGVRG
jgi:AraC-like DNA-binding protein